MERVTSIADVLLTKANGNPFFTHELLKAFNEQGLITFDYSKGTWVWQISELQAFEMADDMAELLLNE